MNYYSRVKPILNKLSELNVYDSLYVVHEYINNCVNKQSLEYIRGVKDPLYNGINIWIADFLIANIIRYCDNITSKVSLRDAKTRSKIITPISEIHQELTHNYIQKDVFIWLNSYIFNQVKISIKENELKLWYKYYYMYKSPKVRSYAEKILGFSIESYFKMAFFLYITIGEKNKFKIDENYFWPKKYCEDDENIKALKYLTSCLSRTLPEMKLLCKEFCSFEEEQLFSIFNAPHIRYPLIREGKTYYCTVPRYLYVSSLEGLYYQLNMPNCPDQAVQKEFSENLENYIGLLFEHYFKGGNIYFKKEIIYDTPKEKSQRTSDWILWDKNDICFLDCKTKRISVKGKQATTLDYELIEKIVNEKPFSGKNKKKEIDSLEDSLTKDLINLGIGLGKIYVCYDEYKSGKISELPDMPKKGFYAILVTLEECFSNTPGYKERIVEIAQSYRQFKSSSTELIDLERVRIMTVKDVEEEACIIEHRGLKFCMENYMDNKKMEENWVKDTYIMDRCHEELISPIIKELEPYYKS